MKDSRLGTMGLVAIAGGLAIKWGGIAGLESSRFLFLMLVPAYAHNEYLQVLAGTGLVGGTIFLALLLTFYEGYST